MKSTRRIASVRRVTKAAAALAIAALFALRLFPNQVFAASETVVKSSAPDQMWVGDEGTFSFYLYGNGANPKKDATVTTKPKGRLATSKIHYKKLRWSSGGSGTSFFYYATFTVTAKKKGKANVTVKAERTGAVTWQVKVMAELCLF